MNDHNDDEPIKGFVQDSYNYDDGDYDDDNADHDADDMMMIFDGAEEDDNDDNVDDITKRFIND